MNRNLILIGLCGEMQSGKDSTYAALVKAGYPARRLSFADPLKEEVAQACEVSVDYINRHKSEFRLGLQWWGTDFRRNLCSTDYWVRQAQAHLDLLCGECSRIIIFTDVRFPNEVNFIRRNGGVIWKVVRPKPLWRRVQAFFAWKHVSEQLQVEPDYVLHNDGTLEDLTDKAWLAFRETANDQ